MSSKRSPEEVSLLDMAARTNIILVMSVLYKNTYTNTMKENITVTLLANMRHIYNENLI